MKFTRTLTILLAAAVMLSVSCNKENIVETPLQDTIVKTVTFNDEIWAPQDVKSEFQENVGVKLTGKENISIYYADHAKLETQEYPSYVIPFKDIQKVGDKYTFTHPAIPDATAYDYYFFMPSLSTSAKGNNNKDVITFANLFYVQRPVKNSLGEDSYDASYDLLVGQPVMNVAPETSEFTVQSFKRQSAPLRLTIKDSRNLLGGEAIQAVTLFFGQKPNQNNALSGAFSIKHSVVYKDCKIIGVGSNTICNGLTALYKDGLAQVGDGYPVWLMAKPFLNLAGGFSQFPGNSDCRLIVTTKTKTIVREMKVPTGGVSVYPDKINTLTIDVSKTENAVAKESVYFDFSDRSMTLASLNKMMASDGNKYDLKPENLTFWNDFDKEYDQILPQGLRMSNNKDGAEGKAGAFTIIPVNGKEIAKLRIYAHPRNLWANTNPLKVTYGTTSVNVDFATKGANITSTGGYAEVVIPNDATGAVTISTDLKARNNYVISGVVVEYR